MTEDHHTPLPDIVGPELADQIQDVAKSVTDYLFRAGAAENLYRAIYYRVPFRGLVMWLWAESECHPLTVRGRITHGLAWRLDEAGYWLNRHHLTRKVR